MFKLKKFWSGWFYMIGWILLSLVFFSLPAPAKSFVPLGVVTLLFSPIPAMGSIETYRDEVCPNPLCGKHLTIGEERAFVQKRPLERLRRHDITFWCRYCERCGALFSTRLEKKSRSKY